jgi:antitoxin VapB
MASDGGNMERAKIFKLGNSQAVRLPKEFQIDAKELQVIRQDGDLILRPVRKTWKDYFDRGRRFSKDFPESIDDTTAEERTPW